MSGALLCHSIVNSSIMIRQSLFFIAAVTVFGSALASHPVEELIDRIDPGASSRFVIRQVDSDKDFFEISAVDGKPAITGNSPVNIAAGLNWYLKYYPHIHLSWDNMSVALPDSLPLPKRPEYRSTDLSRRYYLNYCTHSYSMAFWDWDRWQKEIDWMALHGINMPLALTGMDVVWRNTLTRLGYFPEEIDRFIAGPAYQAWWLMNNLEGCGGPNSPLWYEERGELQRKILARMRGFGMEPVLPGYSGMVPHDADSRLGVSVSGKGKWNGFERPAFIDTTDPAFDRIADIYYEELAKLCGVSGYYSMDPFHEGGNTEGVNLGECGAIIERAMKRTNPEAVWVIQGWNENPRQELMEGVDKGSLVVLDLASEYNPGWGDPEAPAKGKYADGYMPHDWIYCMLLNFGGNVGLHGRMDNVIKGFYRARNSRYDQTLTGVGLTPEGIENNPVMYELLTELIWRPDEFTKEEWIKDYALARYGRSDEHVDRAWERLASTIYNCPWGSFQQGTTESVFCARPSADVWQVSTWSNMTPYYKSEDIIEVAREFAKAAPLLRDNPNYRYDLVDIVRQAVAEKGRLVYKKMKQALESGDRKRFDVESSRFLSLLKAQDRLLSSTHDFNVGTWIEGAKALSHSPEEFDLMEDNARRLITTWGPREASENGRLHDYGHREWGGLLRDLYYVRWSKWIDACRAGDSLSPAEDIDFYEIDNAWVNSRENYPVSGEECVDVALSVLSEYLEGV